MNPGCNIGTSPTPAELTGCREKAGRFPAVGSKRVLCLALSERVYGERQSRTATFSAVAQF